MSRYALRPTPEQEPLLLGFCSHARYVWNLAVEQGEWWKPTRTTRPERFSRQLAEARAEHAWLRAGSSVVQQQALRDYDQAMARFFACCRGEHDHPKGSCGKPGWRKKGMHEGFRIVNFKPGHVRRLSRKQAEVYVPKIGWIRFRWSRPVPDGVKSFRVKRDRVGRWWVSFTHIPDAIQGPGTGEAVGIDRGVTVSAALSNGEMHSCPKPDGTIKRLQRKLSRQQKGSKRRARTRLQVARAHAREANRRRDWAEKLSTGIAGDFDLIRIEDLKIGNMVRSARGTPESPGKNVAQKTGLNREISRSGWGILGTRLEQKAPGRVEKINPAYTSQRCSACGHVDKKSRKNQADFVCTACGFACNADVNAARNIRAGHVRRGVDPTGPPARGDREARNLAA